MTASTGTVAAEVSGDGDGDLRALVIRLWRARLLILASTALGLLLSVAYVLVATPKYRAQVVMIPSESSETDAGLRGAMGELGGLASLAGVKLGGDNQTAEAIALLKAQQFTTEFIEQNNLLPVLFANRWD